MMKHIPIPLLTLISDSLLLKLLLLYGYLPKSVGIAYTETILTIEGTKTLSAVSIMQFLKQFVFI